jgi:flagellar operon protein
MAIDRTSLAGLAVPGTIGPRPVTGPPGESGASFGDALKRAGQDLRLSRHAQKRIDRRELDLDAGRLDRLNDAITSVAQKGGRNSVVLLDDLALVVDVRERTVVTAMNREEGGRNRVFTNIDSVVIA